MTALTLLKHPADLTPAERAEKKREGVADQLRRALQAAQSTLDAMRHTRDRERQRSQANNAASIVRAAAASLENTAFAEMLGPRAPHAARRFRILAEQVAGLQCLLVAARVEWDRFGDDATLSLRAHLADVIESSLEAAESAAADWEASNHEDTASAS